MCAHHVISILEQSHFNNLAIKDEGKQVITNLARYQVLTEDFRAQSQKVFFQDPEPNI